MTADGDSSAARRRAGVVALAATLAIQVFTSLAASAPPVLAPVVAQAYGVPPSFIGVLVAVVYAGAIFGSLFGGNVVARFGAIRVSQVAVVLCAVGIALMAAAPPSLPLLCVGAVMCGMGYGPITPASSEVLARTTRPDRMAVTFSIKQTGVPAGAALAGALLPAVCLVLGWAGAFLAVAVAGLAVVAAAEPTRKPLDRVDPAPAAYSLRSLLGPVGIVLRSRPLRGLSLVGFAFASVQTSLTTFLVVYLADGLGWSLVASGLALTCATASAVAGRILWGMVADRLWAPRRVLTVIGALASVCGALLATAGHDWPAWVLLPLVSAYGATAIGWNGVQLSELARHAPAGAAGAVTGASGALTYFGVVLGPLAFAGLSALTGNYRTGFAACAAVSGLAAAVLWRQAARRRRA